MTDQVNEAKIARAIAHMEMAIDAQVGSRVTLHRTRAREVLAALQAAQRLATHPSRGVVGEAKVRCGDERYELDAYIWRRESTNEWVLELSGGINDCDFTVRHTEPLTTAPEDVASLPSLQAAHPSQGVVDATMVERECEAIARRDGIDWNNAEWQATHKIEAGRLRARVTAALQAAQPAALSPLPLPERLAREADCTDEAARQFYAEGWNACLAAQPAVPSVPEGMVLVRVEPTAEMLDDGDREIAFGNDAEAVWKAMLAANQAHDQPEGEG